MSPRIDLEHLDRVRSILGNNLLDACAGGAQNGSGWVPSGWFSFRRIYSGYPSLKGRLLMAIRQGQVFLDESYSPHSYQTAGWIAGIDFWEAFSPLWRDTLQQPRSIDFFKWREATFLDGEFLGWSEPERDAKCVALASVFPHDNKILQGVACHMTLDDFGKRAKGRTLLRYRNSPYYLEMLMMMLYVNQTFTNFDKIDFLLDQDKCKKSVRVKDFFYKVIKPLSSRFGDCWEMDDKVVMPLQGADLLAAIMRMKHEPDPLFHPAAEKLNGIVTAELDLDRESLDWFFEGDHPV